MAAHSESPSNDTLSVCLGRENPHRLVSLWDIVNVLPLKMLLFSLNNLQSLEWSCYRVRQKGHGGVPTPEKDLEFSRTMLPLAKTVCEQMALASSLRVLDSIMLSLGVLFPEQAEEGPGAPIDVAEFETEIRHRSEEHSV